MNWEVNDMRDYIEINTDSAGIPTESNNIIDSRASAGKSFLQGDCDLSIAVISHNRLEKTKLCIESLLQHTNIPFKLLLIDSGSDIDVMSYYESVPHENKQLIRITKNISANYAFWVAIKYLDSKYCAIVSNDVVVTPNAIENLYTCITSAKDIGWVSPVSSNVSNMQMVNLAFDTLEDMFEKASEYNCSNPLKWHERMVLMPAILLYRKECMDITGGFDYGFFHDFADDDMARRFNHAGYKTILCKDAWVHHDHSYMMDSNEKAAFEARIEKGRESFKQKYNGLDAWDDIRNFEVQMVSQITKREIIEQPCILGVDTRAGTPILEIRNRLREFGYKDTISKAFTTNAKYYSELLTVCKDVDCDRIEFISDYYQPNSFDYILLGEPVNSYANPLKLIKKLYDCLKPKGILLLKLKNTSNYSNILFSLGKYNLPIEENKVCISAESISNCFLALGATISPIHLEYDLKKSKSTYENDSLKQAVDLLLNSVDNQTVTSRVLAQNYIFVAEKP